MKKIRVRLKERSYDILIGKGLIDRAGPLIKRLGLGGIAVVVTNGKLASLFKKRLAGAFAKAALKCNFELVPDSERAKSDRVAMSLISRIAKYDVRQSVFIVVMGGGVVGDLGGFVASIYKRGVPYVQIPTTLLAQVDSGIGGKTAIDLPVAKNLIGAFYQPRLVLSDTAILKSLSRRDAQSGLAEIIKYGVIKDRDLFSYLERNLGRVLAFDKKALEYIISRCSSIKARVVEMDEFDRKDVRAILNYGHTIGHAVEAACGYTRRYSHGEAVGIGMVIANEIAVRMGLLTADDAMRVEELIKRAGLPTVIRGLSPGRIYESLLHDKKFTGRKNKFVLPTRVGHVRVVEGVREGLIKKALRERIF